MNEHTHTEWATIAPEDIISMFHKAEKHMPPEFRLTEAEVDHSREPKTIVNGIVRHYEPGDEIKIVITGIFTKGGHAPEGPEIVARGTNRLISEITGDGE